MRLLSKNIFGIFLILLVISFLFSLLAGDLEREEPVSLGEVAALVREGKVREMTVRGTEVLVKLEDESTKRARKESDAALSETLTRLGVSAEDLTKVKFSVASESGFIFWLGYLLPIIAPLLLIAAFFFFLMRSAQRGAVQALSFGKASIRMASSVGKDRVTFKDVAGLKEAKEELEEVVEFLSNPKKFLAIGARIPRGVLLMGPPGSGKTLLARAVAGEAGVPFFHISGSEFVELFVGVGAARVRDAFATAKRHAPAIIFIDEIDAVGRLRGAGLGGGHDEREQTLNQILVEMDGFDIASGLIILAATNRPDVLDPALLRPGRFDRRVILDLPDINERDDILKLHAKGKPLEKGVALRKVAERTPGFSGADLANVINEAAILAARRNKSQVGELELIQSIEKVLLGPERKSHVLSEREKKIAAYHEGGHAVVAASLPDADPVHKISIISRGRAAGYTLKLPTEDRHLHTRAEFLANLAVLMGGYASEELVFKELTTGASNDLREASELARRIVTEYGMSEAFGPVTWSEREEMVFLGRELATERRFSEKVAAKIDDEVTKLLKRAYETARKLLTSRRAKLEALVARLLEKETIEREEFEAIMATA